MASGDVPNLLEISKFHGPSTRKGPYDPEDDWEKSCDLCVGWRVIKASAIAEGNHPVLHGTLSSALNCYLDER